RGQGGGARPASSLSAVVNADGDDSVGDERSVAAVRVQQFQTARHHLHSGVAVGERGSHGIDLHLVRVRYADQYVDNHLVSGGTDQPSKPETAVVDSIKDGACGRQSVIQAMDIHAHPHFRHTAN